MGRPENPVDYTVPHRGMLADFLRAERRRAGKSYRQMAAGAAGMSSEATLKRAASGKWIPSKKTLAVYLTACESPSSAFVHASKLRLKARCDERGGRRRVFVDAINTPAMLLDGLFALHVNNGARPYEEMQELAGGAPLLPLSSISRILNRGMVPVDEQQMAAFVQGCGVRRDAQEKWMEAWRRAKGRTTTTGFYTPQVLLREMVRQLRDSDLRSMDFQALERQGPSSPASPSFTCRT